MHPLQIETDVDEVVYGPRTANVERIMIIEASGGLDHAVLELLLVSLRDQARQVHNVVFAAQPVLLDFATAGT